MDPAARPVPSEIIEIGAIRVACDTLEIIDEFHSLVKPKHTVPPFIVELTGITNEMLTNAPTLDKTGPKLIDYLSSDPIVAQHCILEETFLNAWIAPLRSGELYTTIEAIEPVALAYPELPSYSLENLRTHFKVLQDAPHRALNDVKDVLQVLVKVRNERVVDNPKLKALIDFIYPSPETTASHAGFWWSWFFESNAFHSYSSLLDVFKSRTRLGDLRQLKQQDQDLEIDWKSSTSSPDELSEILRNESVANYSYREAQASMADQIRQAFNSGKKLLIEAPTGVGKSLGYLVPGYLAATKSAAPVVVSTHSKGLQDQLITKDIPKLKELTHNPEIRGAVVKGQNNYLCLRKLFEQTLHIDSESAPEERFALLFMSHLAVIQPILEVDRISSYVKNRFKGVQQLIDFVKSHHTTTLGPSCPFYSVCHFFDSARLAHESSIIIANHALVLNWPSHLPKIRNIVFDEAHHLEDQLTQALKHETSEEKIRFLVDRIARKRGSRWIGDGVFLVRNTKHLKLGPAYDELDLEDWITDLADTLKTRLTHLESQYLQLKSISQDTGYDEHFVIDQPRYSKNPEINAILEDLLKIDSSLEKIEKWLAQVSEALNSKPGTRDASLDSSLFLLNETHSIRETLTLFCAPQSKETLNLLRILKINFSENTWGIEVLPIEIAEHAKPIWSQLRSIILTSATLTTANQLDFVARRIGIELTELPIQLGSPFKLQTQAQILIPKNIAPPGTPSHFDALMDYTCDITTGLKGRTLLLLTSNRRLRSAVEKLKPRLEPRGFTVLDGLSDSKAVDVFRNSKQALLIGTERHGEGLDIPGMALSCVIIEKINEAMTRGPLAEARKAKSKFSLFDYDFPLRMIWLKQRLGRLIRTHTDFGSIVIFDARFYGWSANSQGIVRKTLLPYPIIEGDREALLNKLFERDAIGLSTNSSEFAKTL